MQRESAALLWDLATAMKRIQAFVAGKAFKDHDSDDLLRSAVERQFEIAGEAMNVLRKSDPRTAQMVPEVVRINEDESAP